MNPYRETAYRLNSARWVRDVLGMSPTAWQEKFLRAPRGALILALTARQVGKTTTAAWAIAHFMVFTSGSLSVIACPAQRQSAEAVRRVREALIKAGAELERYLPAQWAGNAMLPLVWSFAPCLTGRGKFEPGRKPPR